MCAANSNSAANAAANAANSVANTEANDAMKNELKRYLLELNAPQSNSDFMEMGSVLPINNSLLKSY
jgi:hypothetical protein